MSVEPGRTYIITNVRGGTCLDLSAEDNRTVLGWAYHGGDNQKWYAEGYYSGLTFRNVGTGKWLAIEGDPKQGATVIASEERFDWNVVNTGMAKYRIFVPSSGQNIALADYGNSKNGTSVQLENENGDKSQVWRFESV